MNTKIRTEIWDVLHKDPKLSPIVHHCTITVPEPQTRVFDQLLKSIISQQLSTKAAATIYARFLATFDPDQDTADQILKKEFQDFKAVGLSAQKANYIRHVAQHFTEHQLLNVDWQSWSDDAILDELTKIKGVGKWTAEMILMFTLGREDILPLDDLIIRNNMIKLYQVTTEKKQLMDDLKKIAEAWRPYRSYACYYLWAAKDSQYLK